LPLSGRKVERLYVDAAFGIIFIEGREAFEFRIEGPFRIRHAGTEVAYSAQNEDVARLAGALGLLHKTARNAVALKDGTLEIIFSDDSMLVTPPLQDYEAWTMSGPDGFKIVSLPGGGLAVWSAQKRNSPATS
jgi:hypothetical protein